MGASAQLFSLSVTLLFQKWHNSGVRLQKRGPVQEDVQRLPCSFQLPSPLLWWRYWVSTLYMWGVKLPLQSGFPSFPFIVPVHKQSFTTVLSAIPSLVYRSLQCAGPSGMTGTIPVEPATGSFWATWREKTQEKSVTTHCTSRPLPLIHLPQPSKQGRSYTCKLPLRETFFLLVVILSCQSINTSQH